MPTPISARAITTAASTLDDGPESEEGALSPTTNPETTSASAKTTHTPASRRRFSRPAAMAPGIAAGGGSVDAKRDRNQLVGAPRAAPAAATPLEAVDGGTDGKGGGTEMRLDGGGRGTGGRDATRTVAK